MTKAYAPIIGVGAVGGTIIGVLVAGDSGVRFKAAHLIDQSRAVHFRPNLTLHQYPTNASKNRDKLGRLHAESGLAQLVALETSLSRLDSVAGCIFSVIGSYSTHERPTRPISKAKA
jgi:hypothetical protein